MKYLISTLLLTFTLSSFTQAATLEIYGPCQSRPSIVLDAAVEKYETAGDITIALFTKNKIPFQGTEAGINQILHSPLGLEALEVISDTTMYAYGWCYEVDGKISTFYPNEYYLTGEEKVIKWFYGSSEFQKDQWVNFCIPSHLRASSEFCKQIK